MGVGVGIKTKRLKTKEGMVTHHGHGGSMVLVDTKTEVPLLQHTPYMLYNYKLICLDH